MAYRVPTYKLTNDGHQQPFVGNSEQIIKDVRAFGAAGAKHLAFDFRGETIAMSLAVMEEFAYKIMPRVDSLQ